jgi:hypothetical protein
LTLTINQTDSRYILFFKHSTICTHILHNPVKRCIVFHNGVDSGIAEKVFRVTIQIGFIIKISIFKYFTRAIEIIHESRSLPLLLQSPTSAHRLQIRKFAFGEVAEQREDENELNDTVNYKEDDSEDDDDLGDLEVQLY